jgi:hypothetical protein
MYSIHVICYFEGLETRSFNIDYLYFDDLPLFDREMVSDVFLRLSEREVKHLTRISCQAEKVQPRIVESLQYLGPRNGVYRFDYHLNDDDDTLNWYRFKRDHLKKALNSQQLAV